MIYHGDLFDVLPTLADNSVDACVTDGPYGIGFMGKEWDTFKPEAAEARDVPNANIESENPNLKGRTRAPASSPSQIAYDYSLTGLRGFQGFTEAWAKEIFRVLKPGGYILSCGAPRSFHRMACGLEDAGFEIRDTISWIFGSGFPKSLNISKAIDRAAGAEREVIGRRTDGPSSWMLSQKIEHRAHGGTGMGYADGSGKEYDVTAPSTDDAKLWVGWGTALKPGWEPIVLARKPFKSTVAANVLQYGTGGLNIDACRISLDGQPKTSGGCAGTSALHGGGITTRAVENNDLGRWPANVMFDEEAAQLLDEQSGVSTSAGGQASLGAFRDGDIYGKGRVEIERRDPGFGDVGGASRFFYCPKPDRAERDMGTQRLAPRQRDESRKEGNPGGDNPRNRGLQPRGNYHPTVKPIELMRYLIRLITPIGGTVIDPFLGSGTTGIAARFEQRPFISIEREAEYIPIAEARIADAIPLFEPEPEIVVVLPQPTLFEESNS